MGRFPFVTRADEFFEAVKDTFAPTTLREYRSGLGHVHRVLQELKSEGRISTTDPKQLRCADLLAFLERKREAGIGPGREAWYLSALDALLRFHGNGAVGELRGKRLHRRLPMNAGPLSCPAPERVREDAEALGRSAPEGPANLAVFGAFVFTAFAWVRVKEVRLATLGDVAADVRELRVLHPKGEHRYAAPRRAFVTPDGRALVQDFLDLRAVMLKRLGIEDGPATPLIPKVRGRTVGFYSTGGLETAKRKVERALGLRFTFRENRRAGGQAALDRGADLSAVSKGLGHSTTVTTERHYARVKVDRAFEELERAYAAPRLQTR